MTGRRGATRISGAGWGGGDLTGCFGGAAGTASSTHHIGPPGAAIVTGQPLWALSLGGRERLAAGPTPFVTEPGAGVKGVRYNLPESSDVGRVADVAEELDHVPQVGQE